MNDELYPPAIDRLDPPAVYKEERYHLGPVDRAHCFNRGIGSLIYDATSEYKNNRQEAIDLMLSIAGRLNQLAIKYKALHTQQLIKDKQQIEKELNINNEI